jgi:N-acetyl-anhydromuramyl-L-alanine amidase AmpD
MKVIDHWLDTATHLPYPEGPLMGIRRFLVIHFTAGATAKSSVEFWREPEAKGAEAHIIIDRDGTVYQVRATNQRADHAGKSRWRCPRTNKVFEWLNSCSIGIELANAGDNAKLAARMKGKTMKARHKNGGPLTEWETYPEAQFNACVEVAQALVKRYSLDDIVGHDDIAPDRKNDPGPAFPMQKLREACGFSGPVPKF